MRGRFYKATQQASARNAPRRAKGLPKITKEGRAVLNARRKESSAKYHEALEQAWASLEETISRIATDHRKSIRRVESDLRLGRPVSLQQHSRKSAWNAFLWKKCLEEKENISENGMCH